jgi:hypothetical protein
VSEEVVKSRRGGQQRLGQPGLAVEIDHKSKRRIAGQALGPAKDELLGLWIYVLNTDR